MMQLERERFDVGLKEIRVLVEQLRLNWEARDEIVSVEREVDEPYQKQQTVWEDVIVKPAGWFREAVTERVKKTVTVTRHRKVVQAFSEKRRAFVNGFGKVLSLPEGFDALQWAVVPPGRFMMGASAALAPE